MKNLILLVLFISNIFCDELDLNKFEDRQSAIEDIKALIVFEERLAVTYEKFILNNYKKPLLNDLLNNIDNFHTKKITLAPLTLTNDKFNNRLPSNITSNEQLFEIYKSNKYRNRTYFYNNNIYFILQDDFTNHIYGLIKYNKGEILNCPTGTLTVTKQNCKYNNHIYFNLTKIENSNPIDYEMAYFLENFKLGPVVFDSQKLNIDSNSIFQNIPIGAILYDFEENKYIKTKYGIKVLK